MGYSDPAYASSSTLELHAHHEALVKLFHTAGVKIDEGILKQIFMLLHLKVPVDAVLDMFIEVEGKDIEYHDIRSKMKSQSKSK